MSKKRTPPPAPVTAQRDLVVLAADKDTSQAVEGLLRRGLALQMRQMTFDVIRHPDHDPGCLGQSPGLLQVYLKSHSRALVVFDREGCGQEQYTREELEAQVETQLDKAGWKGRAAVIVIDPELENWVWSQSPHVSTALGWRDENQGVREWLLEKGFPDSEALPKPARPKEAMLAVLRHVRKPPSSAIHRAIADKVSFAHCTDPAFVKFRQTLQTWFPA